MLRKFRKLFFVFIIGLFLYDGIHDTASAHEPVGQEANCHTCVCGNHFVPSVPNMEAVVIQSQSFVVPEKKAVPYYPSTSIFHPPEVLA